MNPKKNLLITQVTNGWRINRGNSASDNPLEEYVALTDEQVFEIVEAHLEASRPRKVEVGCDAEGRCPGDGQK